MGSRYFTERLKDANRHIVNRRYRTSRPKTFKTEETANEWAKANGITKYTLENLKAPESKSNKIKVVAE